MTDADTNTEKVTKKTKSKKMIDPKDVAKPESPDESTAPFLAMDQRDDEQIMLEVQGKAAEVAEEWVYSYKDKEGREVTGLSWTGTKFATYYFRRNKMSDLAITDLTYEKDPTDPDYFLFKAKCEDKINGGGMWGVKRQWTKMRLRDGSTVTNPFWYEQGTSKAQRNAMQSMMPADWIASFIKEKIGKGSNVKTLSPLAQRTMATGSTPNDVEKEKLKEFYSAIEQAVDRTILGTLEQQVIKNTTLSPREKYLLRKAIEVKAREFPVESV